MSSRFGRTKLVTGRKLEGASAATSVRVKLDLLARVWRMLAVLKSISPTTATTSLQPLPALLEWKKLDTK